MRALSARVLALALSLVLLTTLAAGIATVQFARAAARSEQRAELKAQASLVALQPARLVTRRGLQRVAAGLDGSLLAVVDADAAPVASSAPPGSALVAATRSAAVQAVRGADVSSATTLGGQEVLVEARPLASGGAFVLARPVNAFTRLTRDLVARILVVLLTVSAVAAVAAVLLSRRITRPLAEVAGAARRLAAGERRVPVPEQAPVEVHDVAEALRALDDALATSEGRQREFLLSISHEIRTPLTALQGYGEALADGVVTGDRVREVGAVLMAETARVERFTADLLELARLEADDFSVAVAEVDLREVAEETAVAWRARADAAGVDLRQQVPEGVRALADPRRARQVVDGLVENALRATPAGGSITLRSVRVVDRVGIAVEDTGPGLSDDDLAEAFTRGLLRERYRESRQVGTGLGLSIVTRLAGRMGGRVTAARADGGGARFALELPAA
ncbi:sensor histidine kinase [Amnibacterium endophyticum]|uniref:histidine kinase n=1 Tax=Amnibacterium endophyticum TaxID=2109337 RepID=A0ABW4LIB6_9MICO